MVSIISINDFVEHFILVCYCDMETMIVSLECKNQHDIPAAYGDILLRFVALMGICTHINFPHIMLYCYHWYTNFVLVLSSPQYQVGSQPMLVH